MQIVPVYEQDSMCVRLVNVTITDKQSNEVYSYLTKIFLYFRLQITLIDKCLRVMKIILF